jgi:hypothetical protein
MNHHVPSVPPDDFPLSAYRDRTLSMLRRYNRAAVETGRLPSLLGREFFRARVTSYTMHTLEDAVIFVFDIERCLAELTCTERTLIGRIVLQEFTQAETARLMGCHLRSIERLFPDAIDHLTEIMLERRLLSPSILAPRSHRQLHLVARPAAEVATPAAMPSQQPQASDQASVVPIRNISIQACQAPTNRAFAATA